MRRRTAVLVAVLMAAGLVIGAQASQGASWSERECIEDGGTFDRVQGEVICLIVTEDPVGNSENSGGKSQSTTTETENTGRGNSGNKPQSSTECTGPGNSGEGGGPCP